MLTFYLAPKSRPPVVVTFFLGAGRADCFFGKGPRIAEPQRSYLFFFLLSAFSAPPTWRVLPLDSALAGNFSWPKVVFAVFLPSGLLNHSEVIFLLSACETVFFFTKLAPRAFCSLLPARAGGKAPPARRFLLLCAICEKTQFFLLHGDTGLVQAARPSSGSPPLLTGAPTGEFPWPRPFVFEESSPLATGGQEVRQDFPPRPADRHSPAKVGRGRPLFSPSPWKRSWRSSFSPTGSWSVPPRRGFLGNARLSPWVACAFFGPGSVFSRLGYFLFFSLVQAQALLRRFCWDLVFQEL